MKINIFSKFDMAGGSEFRCAELCNGLARYTNHAIFLLAEKNIPDRIKEYIDSKVCMIENSLSYPDYFYQSDCIIIINTDSREFSTVDYWIGKSHKHNIIFDLEKFKNKKIFFLYNFIVSPSRNLFEFEKYDLKINIITTNRKFFDEITKQDRYEKVRFLPRYMLGSPINQSLLKIRVRNPIDNFCIGMHSKGLDNKWNNEWKNLIKEINKRYPDNRVKFRFMGIKNSLRGKIDKISNVECLKENKEEVSEFIDKLDIFVFFPDWKREEPWARVIAEAMVSGCPVLTLDRGGAKDQVLHYNNGFLCKDRNSYFKNIVDLIEHPDKIKKMSENSIRIAKDFYTENIIKKLIDIIER